MNTKDYLNAILFAETDDDGEWLERNYCVSSFAPCAIDKARQDIATFQRLVASSGIDISDIDPRKCAQYLLFSREGSEDGFLNGVNAERGKALHSIAQSMGHCYAYVRSNGLIYLS